MRNHFYLLDMMALRLSLPLFFGLLSRLNAILPSNFRRQKGGYLTESLEMAFVESDDVGDSVNNHHSRYHRVVNLNAFDRVSRDKSPPLLMCS